MNTNKPFKQVKNIFAYFRLYSIRQKLLLLVCSLVLTTIIISIGFGYFFSSHLIRDLIIARNKIITKAIAQTISDKINSKIREVQVLSTSPFWLSYIEEDIKKYYGKSEDMVKSELLDMDKKWISDLEDNPLIKEILTKPLSNRFKRIVEEDKEISEILLADSFGGLLAASGKTTDFYQADEKWWQEAYNKGKGKIFIGDIEFDDSTSTWSIAIAVPEKKDDEQIIGICKMVLNLKVTFLPLEKITIGQTGHVSLVGQDNQIIFHEGVINSGIEFCSEDDFKILMGSKDNWTFIKNMHLHRDNMFVNFTSIDNSYLLENDIHWFLVMAQAEDEIVIPITKLFRETAIIAGIVLAIFIFLAFIMGGKFVKPIEELRQVAEHIGKGEIDYPINIKTTGEIEQLAEAFKIMVSNIKDKEDMLLREKEYLDSIIYSMRDSLVVFDYEGIILKINQATSYLLGYTQDELIGKNINFLFAENEENVFSGNYFKELLEKCRLCNFQIIYKTKYGESIPVSFSGNVMYKTNGDNRQHVIGIVGVARDMRQIQALITDLRKTKNELEEFSKELDLKVQERTKELKDAQAATLNIMEDIQISRNELEKTNFQLKKAKEEIESFSRGLEIKVKERTLQLSVLYEVSNAIAYTLDYQTLFKLIMESLFKIVDYDISVAVLFDSHRAEIAVKPAYPQSSGLVNEVKNDLLDYIVKLTGEDIREKHTNLFFIPTVFDIKLKEERIFDKIRSSLNIPLIVRGKTIGVLKVSSCKDNAFSEDDKKFINVISNQTSNAILRLQSVVTAQQSKMESLVESMGEGVIMLDERGHIIILNPQAKKMLGFELDQEITNKILDEKMKVIGLYEVIKEAQDKKRLLNKEVNVSEQEDIVLRFSITVVQGVEGNIIGTVIILRDVTKEKELDKIKTEFVATVSHELRTPLTTMKEFASIIFQEIPGKLTQQQKDYVNIIINNIERLTRLINDLLDISKIEAGKINIKRSLLDITSLVNNTIIGLKSKANSKNIEINTTFDQPIANIYLDPDRITQLFINLIANAINYTPDNGKITVEIKDKGKELECSIADTGVGIAPENLGKVFTMFQQFSRVPGSGAKGTGLGLAISKKIVDLHNGKIWVESKLGQGSKFIFTLPRIDAETIIRDYIDTSLDEAKKVGASLSILVIQPPNLKKIGLEKNINIDAQKIMAKIEEVINDVIRKQSDIMLKFKRGSFVLILPNTKKDGALVIKKRIDEAMRKYNFFTEDKNIEFFLTYAMASYPEEEIISNLVDSKDLALTKGKTILVVDDDEDSIVTLRAYLEVNGYITISAYNGKEALDLMQTQIPNLVIADVTMPVLDGYGLRKAMEEDDKLSSIPFIFLSGIKTDFEDKITGIIRGACDYILKPYDYDDLLAKIKKFLG